ncbi:MAG: dTDP-4-dehydrorhamnose 3,5-epimerase [Hyphomicrobiaceae bacterium]
MDVVALDIPDVKLITPKRFGDARGFFSEVYVRRRFHEAGIADDFVQENQSLSRAVATLRGLHLQTAPHAQAKLVRCVRGRIWDVAVDLRSTSPTYCKWVAAELSPENWSQLYIPIGFAHGFLTLEPDTEVIYQVTAYYAPDCDLGVAWDDPDLGVAWPLAGRQPVLSDKDQRQARLKDLAIPF